MSFVRVNVSEDDIKLCVRALLFSAARLDPSSIENRTSKHRHKQNFARNMLEEQALCIALARKLLTAMDVDADSVMQQAGLMTTTEGEA